MESLDHNYIPGEIWSKVLRIPFWVQIAVEGAGRSGFSGSIQEREKGLTYMIESCRERSENPLIYRILPDTQNKSELTEAVIRHHDQFLEELALEGVSTNKALQDRIFDVLPNLLESLRQYVSETIIEDYKVWLLHLAETVAMAAKENDLLGIGGERFSSAEKEFYTRLEKLLN
ncbi:hypothetical protein [Robiginitalea sp. IMCC43444]|uniref:hypothetical protein n=1 Tax=Robiginitalea sp. IMCC43444 TaxID=3459121 RepID=UPI0040429A97